MGGQRSKDYIKRFTEYATFPEKKRLKRYKETKRELRWTCKEQGIFFLLWTLLDGKKIPCVLQISGSSVK